MGCKSIANLNSAQLEIYECRHFGNDYLSLSRNAKMNCVGLKVFHESAEIRGWESPWLKIKENK